MPSKRDDYYKLADPSLYEIREGDITDVALVIWPEGSEELDVKAGATSWVIKFQDGADQFRAHIDFHNMKDAPFNGTFCRVTGTMLRDWINAEKEDRGECNWQNVSVERWYVTEVASKPLTGIHAEFLASKTRGNICAFYGKSEEEMLFAHAEQIRRAATKTVEAHAKFKPVRVDVQQEIVTYVRDHDGERLSKSKVADGINRNRNKVFALIDELRASETITVTDDGGWHVEE